MAEKNKNDENANSLIVAALVHAREMALHASDIRMRNFNFFVILVGALITVYSQVKHPWIPTALGLFGMVISLLFLGLDMRGRELLDRAMRQFEMTESMLWDKAALPSVQPFPQSSMSKVISHTFIYRLFYIIVALTSLAVTLFTLFV